MTIVDSLQQYNPNLVDNTGYDIAGAFAPAVQNQGNIVPAPVPDPQVQEEQQDGDNGASSHD
eukprot:2593634-Amphidinium_carterae.1